MRNKVAAILIGGLALACAGPLSAEPSLMEFEIVAPDDLVWVPIPGGLGAAYAVVRGDPTKAGTYVIRVRFPAGVMDYPHAHDRDRHVTVLEGAWLAGTGPDFDPGAAAILPAGAYMFHPAGGVHWDGAASDQDAVVQIIGEGPVKTMQEHDETADWVKVK